MGPKSNGKCPNERPKRGGHGAEEKAWEIVTCRVCWSDVATNRGKSRAARKRQEGPSPPASGGGTAGRHLDLGFEPPELGEDTLLWFQAP